MLSLGRSGFWLSRMVHFQHNLLHGGFQPSAAAASTRAKIDRIYSVLSQNGSRYAGGPAQYGRYILRPKKMIHSSSCLSMDPPLRNEFPLFRDRKDVRQQPLHLSP